VKHSVTTEVAWDEPAPVDNWSMVMVATLLASLVQRGTSAHGTLLSGISAHFKAAPDAAEAAESASSKVTATDFIFLFAPTAARAVSSLQVNRAFI
jgi:hypothetical protein